VNLAMGAILWARAGRLNSRYAEGRSQSRHRIDRRACAG
jgi:hypothetical protein